MNEYTHYSTRGICLRVVKNITNRGPSDWKIETASIPLNLLYIIDKPEEHLPQSLPQVDLIIFLSESQNTPQLTPDFIPLTGAKGVIVPIEKSSWMSLGLKV